jgi:hypothetical protein
MRVFIIIIFHFFLILLDAQSSFDSLPPSSGLASILISGPFNCPSPKQKIKFPPQFYNESRKNQILEISYNEIESSVPCISSKRNFTKYDDDIIICDWWNALRFIPQQCDKWKRSGAGGATSYFKQKFYKSLSNTTGMNSIFVPELSFHYFYFDKDTVPDLVAYDCTDGTNSNCRFFIPSTDTVIEIKGIIGYPFDIRNNGKQLTIKTKWRLDFYANTIYTLTFNDEKIILEENFVVVSEQGLKLPQYTLDKKFILHSTENLNDCEEEFPENSTGYVLGEDKQNYFVAMNNNLYSKTKYFRSGIELGTKKPAQKFYTLGWITKEKVFFK